MISKATRSTSLVLPSLWLALIALAALLAPLFFSDISSRTSSVEALLPPSWAHWMGTDLLGRDLFTRVLCGSRVSLGVGVSAVIVAFAVGIAMGAAAGYAGGWIDKLLMAFSDLMLCVPVFFLILAVIAVLGPSVTHLLWIIGLTSWMGPARLMRAEVLTLKEREYVMASRVMGASAARILIRHLVPNAIAPVIVSAVLALSSAILIETGLSFLGVGVQPPTPSWGNILMDGKSVLGAAWWVTFFPGLVIFLTVFSVNLIGEQLTRKIRGVRHAG